MFPQQHSNLEFNNVFRNSDSLASSRSVLRVLRRRSTVISRTHLLRSNGEKRVEPTTAIANASVSGKVSFLQSRRYLHHGSDREFNGVANNVPVRPGLAERQCIFCVRPSSSSAALRHLSRFTALVCRGLRQYPSTNAPESAAGAAEFADRAA